MNMLKTVSVRELQHNLSGYLKLVKDIMKSPFIGMHKNKKEWHKKTSAEIAHELRKKAWYGI